MSEMVERVAKALAAQDFSCDWGWVAPHYQEAYLESARAAIEAMREPTEGMKECGREETGSLATALAAWDSMIDEALKQ